MPAVAGDLSTPVLVSSTEGVRSLRIAAKSNLAADRHPYIPLTYSRVTIKKEPLETVN